MRKATPRGRAGCLRDAGGGQGGGAAEYFLFDRLSEYLVPPLQGYELVEGEYAELPADACGRLISRKLGLRLAREGQRLRLSEVASGQPLRWRDEAHAVSRTAEAQIAAEAAARQAADADLAVLRAELARLRGDATDM